MSEFEEILQRASRGPLSSEDVEKLRSAVHTLFWVQGEISRKDATLGRLRKLLFETPKTEKTSQVLGEAPKKETSKEGEEAEEPPPVPPKGHGRNGAAEYAGAPRVTLKHETLQPGDPCPDKPCEGKVYPSEPRVLVSVKGNAPISATVYERETLRCSVCGKVFVAGLPAGLHNCKYDATAAAMIGLLKYGTGMPFYRLDALEENLGIPLPAATQWEIVRDAAKELAPAHEELIRQAAQAEVIHNDDTTMTILEHVKENRTKEKEERTGTFTTGIVAEVEGHRIALFLTGRDHAGENLTKVLQEREGQRAPPIQMCDGLDRNLPDEPFETILANCLGHGRRNFVEVPEGVPACLGDVAGRLSPRRFRTEGGDVARGAPSVPPGAQRPAHGRAQGLVSGCPSGRRA